MPAFNHCFVGSGKWIKATAILSVFASAPIFVSQNASASETVHVPSDPKTQYSVIDFEVKSETIVQITTERNGTSGRSYSKREVDCGSNRFRYLGDGDTVAQMNASTPDASFSNLVPGSISDVISKYACRRAGMR